MKKGTLIKAAGLATLVLVGYVTYLLIYLYYYAPTGDEIGAAVADNLKADAQLLSDTNNTFGNGAFLVQKVGNYYEFGMFDKGEGGGEELIAELNSTGHFEVIWHGQDYPDCAPIDSYSVPAEISDKCFINPQDPSRIKVIDRTNFVRRFMSYYFNTGR